VVGSLKRRLRTGGENLALPLYAKISAGSERTKNNVGGDKKEKEGGGIEGGKGQEVTKGPKKKVQDGGEPTDILAVAILQGVKEIRRTGGPFTVIQVSGGGDQQRNSEYLDNCIAGHSL